MAYHAAHTSIPRQQAERRPYSAGAITEAGVAGGVAGGIAMAAFLMGYAQFVQGGNAAAPLQTMGATFYGPDALIGGLGVVVWGALLHLTIAAALGAVFAWIVGPYPRGGASVGWGITYSLVVMLAMTYLVLPWANPTMFERVPLMMGAWATAHVVYGFGLALAPGYLRRS